MQVFSSGRLPAGDGSPVPAPGQALPPAQAIEAQSTARSWHGAACTLLGACMESLQEQGLLSLWAARCEDTQLHIHLQVQYVYRVDIAIPKRNETMQQLRSDASMSHNVHHAHLY